MTRDEFAQKICWNWIIWFAGLVNVVAMLPQLIKIWQTQNVEGVSLSMFSMYFGIQMAFALEGFFKRNRMLTVCLGLSALVTGTIIISILCLRT